MNAARRLADILPPLLTVAALIAGWQLLVRITQLPARLLPAPSAVLARLQAGILGGDMLGEIAHSAVAVLAGYALACLAALVMAIIFAESRRAERVVYPLVATFQAIPKVALAPLVILWAGFGLRSEVILIAMIAFFPIFANAFIGLSGVSRDLADLFRVHDGGRLFRILHLSLPSAAGQIFAGMQISIGLALVGCVVVEFLVGTDGVGFLIQNSANSLDTATAVAAMVTLGVMGAVAGLALRSLRRLVVFWDRAEGVPPRAGAAR
jgi:NitT/TauT family transport system permease protein